MSESANAVENIAKSGASQVSWRRETVALRRNRFRLLAISCCLLASLVAILMGMTTLSSRRPNPVLISFYMMPPADEAIGIDAPFHPFTNRLFDLKAKNIEEIGSPISEKDNLKNDAKSLDGTALPPDLPKLPRTTFELTDWRRAVATCGKNDEMILHVSSLARVEHGQVVFYGRGETQTSSILFEDVLSAVAKSEAKKSLIALDVFWPVVSDQGKSDERLKQLDQAIRGEFERLAPRTCQLLMTAPHSLETDKYVIGSVSAHPPRSILCNTIQRAIESSSCDTNRDGRISLDELVGRSASATRGSLIDSERSCQLSLIGDPIGFEFLIPKNTEETQARVYPTRLADSWQLRGQYLQTTGLPFVFDTALRWGNGLDDLEMRWRRGEPGDSIQREAEQLEQTCVEEILQAIELAQREHSESLSVAALRFPINQCLEAERSAAELLERCGDNLANHGGIVKPEETAKWVAEFVAKFPPTDAPLALNAVLQTIEKTASLDAESWSLICDVRKSFRDLQNYAIVSAIDSLAQRPFDPVRFGQQLRLCQLQGCIGTDKRAAAFISKPMDDAFQAIAIAQQMSTFDGMTQPAVIDRYVMQAISTAEAASLAEQVVSQTIRRLDLITVSLSLDSANALLGNANSANLLAEARQAIELLQRIQKKSDAGGKLPAAELAFLRQRNESIDRKLSQRMKPIAQPPVNRSLTSLSLVSATPSLPKHRDSFQTDGNANAGDLAGLCKQLENFKCDAEQRSRASRRAPVRVAGDLQQLSWARPDAIIHIFAEEDTSEGVPIQFQILPPASSSIQIDTEQGTLASGKPAVVRVSLRKRQNGDEQPCELRGIWVKVSCGSDDTLIPIFMTPQPSLPRVDIDFGAGAAEEGHNVSIPFWPSNESQTIQWSIRSIDPTLKIAVVSIQSPSGDAIVSQPIELNEAGPVMIAFPPPKPTAPDQAKPDRLAGPLTVSVKGKDGELLGQWNVSARIGDPRRMVQPGSAKFLTRDDGTNRLEVEVACLPDASDVSFPKFSAEVRLELGSDRAKSKSLIDVESGKLQAILDENQSSTLLYADNLRFVEGGPVLMTLPLSINGDRGYFELAASFPRRSGTVQLSWNQEPRLCIRAAQAVSSDVPLRATIQARDLSDETGLLVEVFTDSNAASDKVWTTKLSTSRRVDCTFASAGPSATLAVEAMRSDWTLSIPSTFGTGEYRLRVSTATPVGIARPYAEHRFFIDDHVPTRIQARADVAPDRTIIHLVNQPSASGVASLSIQSAINRSGEKPTAMAAQSVDPSGSHWQVKWPGSIPLPEQIELTFVTGAGKQYTTTCDLPVLKIEPVGKIIGKVFEGSIAQPRLVVTLRNPAGAEVAKYMTDQDGQFEFSVSPGQYQLTAEKAATRRNAMAQVSVGQGESLQSDLRLTREVPSAAF